MCLFNNFKHVVFSKLYKLKKDKKINTIQRQSFFETEKKNQSK